METWIGPLFVPGRDRDAGSVWRTAAWASAAWKQLSRDATGISRPLAPPPAAMPRPARRARRSATEITRFIGSGGQSALRDLVVATNALTLERTRHILIHRPQCPSCGAPVLLTVPLVGGPVRLSAAPESCTPPTAVIALRAARGIGATGTSPQSDHRHRARADTGERSGVAERCTVLTPMFADHNFAFLSRRSLFLEGSGGVRRQGEESGTGARECARRIAGALLRRVRRKRTASRAASGAGRAAIHPNDCLGFSDRQYAERATPQGGRPQRQKARRCVAEPFREDVEIEWTPLWSLVRGPATCRRRTAISAIERRSAVRPCRFQRVRRRFRPRGGGPAGLLELVERDAVAIWWYNRLRRPAVDLETSMTPTSPELVRHTASWPANSGRSTSRATRRADVRRDVRRVDAAEEDVIYGFGVHLDPPWR